MKLPLSIHKRLLPTLGVLLVLGTLLCMLRFWHPVFGFTQLIQLDRGSSGKILPVLEDTPVYVYQDKGGYDGISYAQIATDPSLSDPLLERSLDNLAYRGRRILTPALAWVLGGGNALSAVHAYSAINILFWLLLAFLLWKLLAVDDWYKLAAWAGLLFSAGSLGSFRLALVDLPSLTLLCAAFLLLERKREKSATLLFAASILARETAVLGLAGLRQEMPRRPADLKPWLCPVLFAVLPMAAWLLYIRWRVGSANQGWDNLHAPVQGWLEKVFECGANFYYQEPLALSWLSLLCFAALCAQAALILKKWSWDDPWWRVGVCYVGLMAMLGTAVWEGHPGAATRVLLPLHLACTVLLCRSSRSWLWLIAINLCVSMGLYALLDTQGPRGELAAFRSGEKAAVFSLEKQWWDLESKGAKRWLWSERSRILTLETWPKTGVHEAEIALPLRSISPRVVKVFVDGHEIAELKVGPKPTVFRVTKVQVRQGRAQVELRSDTPGDHLPGDSRTLGFCLLQPTILSLTP